MDSASLIRLLSYNIHKGVHFLSRNEVFSGLIESIEGTAAEWVFLQEFSGEEERLEALADSIWSHHAYGKNATRSGGRHHGNAILSADPILNSTNFDLTLHRLEQRGCLLAEVVRQTESGPVNCFLATTHLNLRASDRREQISRVIRFLKESVPADAPLILAGDFNDWTEELSPELFGGLNLEEVFSKVTGSHALTFPSFWPILPLDRVYVRGFEVRSAEVLQSGSILTSDHCPISVHLEVLKSG